MTQVSQVRNLQELKKLKESPLQLPPKGREPTKVGLGVKADRRNNEVFFKHLPLIIDHS